MRNYIYRIISKSNRGDKLSTFYDWFIMIVAFISVVPMMTRNIDPVLQQWIETPTIYLLFFDYILRWIICDIKRENHSPISFFLYPLTPFAIMDILGILPSLGLLPVSFSIFRLMRLGKILQYSKSFHIIVNVFRNQKKTLLSVLLIALSYIFISALIMFSYEPAQNFPTFFDALYWATTALTTVGYGDIYPCTEIGKLVSMISSVFGVAVIAMPAGVVTAGFMSELEKINVKKGKSGGDENAKDE